MIELEERNLNDFFKVPFQVYPADFGFVSPLKSDLKRFLSLENPLFKLETDYSFFTVKKNGNLQGRVVAMIHRSSQEKFKWKRAQFGFLDCANDVEIANSLMMAAEKFAMHHGADELVGNFNLTANQAIGVVTKIHRPYHYTDQVFAPVYISELLEKCGFEKFFPMATYEQDIRSISTEKLLGEKQKAILKNTKFEFKKVRKNKFEEVMEAMRICLNDGFQDNPMAVALTKEEIYFQAKDLMLVVDEEISTIAYYEGRPVGALICIPDLNPLLKNIGSQLGISTPYYFLKHKLQKTGAVGIFYSVAKDFQSQGLNGVMMYQVVTALQKRGYKNLGGTWISLENTSSIRQAEKLGMKVMHELHLYRKKLV